jgi:predicted AlkP superfamily phosphohydrolase/phosphomutase
MRRVLVIGLDGMPLTLARELAAAGVMPRLGELLGTGRTAELIAPVPEVSSTSWATFLTGVNPARHGIYGFTDLRPGSYDAYFPNLTDLRARPLWEHAAAQGLTTLALNVPGTYPAPRMRGAVISGFVAPLAERAVQPPRLAQVLRQTRYQIEADVGDVSADPAAFVARLREALAARVRAFTHLLRHEPWDLAVAVVTETDRLQHFLWRQLTDPGDRLHGPILDLYRDVDAAVASLAGYAAGRDTDIFIVSDHGFGPARCQFYVNPWLRSRGWLPPLAAVPSLSALDGSSQVFALDPGRFYINAKDRFPRGTLTQAQATQLAADLAGALRGLRWRNGPTGPEVGPDVDGPKLLSEVYLREEIYHGPLAALAPDVIAVPSAGVQLRGGWQPPASPGSLTGTHTRGNALLWTSRDDITAEVADMTDIAPTLLGCLGAAPGGAAPGGAGSARPDSARPGDFDGRDLRAAARLPDLVADWRP